MTRSHDRIVAAFDSLASAVDAAPRTKKREDAFLVASLSPSDTDKNEREMDDFRVRCDKAAEKQCVLILALII